MKLLSLILICLVFTGCLTRKAPDLIKPQWFDYKILVGVTGIDKCISVNKKEIAIIYHDDSDQIHKKALLALKYNLFYADQNNIKIYGYLLPEVNYTISGVGMAASEQYQYFKLLNWSIKSPILFYDDLLDNGNFNIDGPPKIIKTEHLLIDHFRDNFVLNPSQYEAK